MAAASAAELLAKSAVELREGKADRAAVSADQAVQFYKDATDAAGAACAAAQAVVAHVAAGSAAAGAETARRALALCKAAKDVKGEASTLLALAQARLAAREADAAIAAARRAASLFKDQGDARRCRAEALAVVAAAQLQKGYWELSLRASREAQQVLGEDESDEQLTAKVVRLIVRAHHARGEEPPGSARRSRAQEALAAMGAALSASDAVAFAEAFERLRKEGAYSDTDLNRIFAPALDADAERAEAFLSQHMKPSAMDEATYDASLQWLDTGAPPEVVSLRTFPSFRELQQPSQDKVLWEQSHGQIWAMYRLQDGPRAEVPGGWDVEDVVVEMSERELKVTIGGAVVKELSGELMEKVWRKDSWWAIDEDEPMLVITMHKRRLANWHSPFYHMALATFKRTSFAWTQNMMLYGDNHNGVLFGRAPKDGPDESQLEPVAPGRPEPEEDAPGPGGAYVRTTPGDVFAPRSERFLRSAEDMVLGITAEQDERHIVIQVHFERFAFEDFTQMHPLEKLLAADVWRNAVCIFFQGDKLNPIVWGELDGDCVPYQTTWRMLSSEPMRRRQEMLGSYSPALELRLRKDWHSRGMWANIFGKCVQAKLMTHRWQEGQPRFQGLPDVPTARRAGYDLESPDFWSFVDEYCHETLKKTGPCMAPRRIAGV